MTKIICLFLFCLTAAAQHSDHSFLTYYPLAQLDKLENQQLKEALFNIISKNQQTFKYTKAKQLLFQEIDLQFEENDPYLFDIYCHQNFTKGVGQNSLPSDSLVNCEHAWPQTRFSKHFWKSIQKADLHHLFVTSAAANRTRSDRFFGEVPGGIDVCGASVRGKIEDKHYFEPPKLHRGDLARALFYFSIRYQQPIGETEEYFLKKWHHDDPVSEDEKRRHQKIFSLQKNRNPFIDFPELVEAIEDF